MTGGNVIILGEVGDNFAAGMTGGMAFVYDEYDEFEKKANPETIIWQRPETEYWMNFLKNLIRQHHIETGSNISENIFNDFENKVKKFYQICPKEMLDKLANPITEKDLRGVAS